MFETQQSSYAISAAGIDALANSTANACEVILSDDGKYVETLSIKAISAQPGRIELVTRTQLLTAKRPTETRVKSRTCIRYDRLVALHQALGQFLADQAGAGGESLREVDQ